MHREMEAVWNGQVAQSVEHSPEKAGVVGSNPTLSTERNRHKEKHLMAVFVSLVAVTA